LCSESVARWLSSNRCCTPLASIGIDRPSSSSLSQKPIRITAQVPVMASSRRGRSRSRRNGEWEGGYLRCHDSGGGGGAEAVGEAFSGTKNGSFRAPPGGVFARAGSAIGGTRKVRPHRRHFAFLPENSSFRLKALPHPGQSQLIMVSWPPQNLWRRFRVRLRALRRTGQLKRKRASNQGRSSNPRQGAKKTAPGRRPLAGARHKHCFSCMSLTAQVGGFGGSSS
jgi:hypothetical protein